MTRHLLRMCEATSPLPPYAFMKCTRTSLPLKKDIKFTLQPDMKSHGELELYLYFFFNLGVRMGGLSTPHASGALSLGNDLVPFV